MSELEHGENNIIYNMKVELKEVSELIYSLRKLQCDRIGMLTEDNEVLDKKIDDAIDKRKQLELHILGEKILRCNKDERKEVYKYVRSKKNDGVQR